MTLEQWIGLISTVAQLLIIALFLVLLFLGFLQRNMPRVGGKIGRRCTLDPATPAPDGFSHEYAREMTVFVASSSAANFANLKDFLRHGTAPRRILMRIYRVAGCKTEIEIPAEAPGYNRINAVEALALLRQLPDLRLIHRLHLSDEPSFLQPWARKLIGPETFLLGNATNFSLVVLYKPDRRFGSLAGLTLLHEWLHLVAFRSLRHVHRFKRANAIEPLAPPEFEPLSLGGLKDSNSPIYEAWCELGEKLFGYDDSIARDAALAFPVHGMILWQRVEKILHKTRLEMRSSRLAEFEARSAFMHTEVRA